MRDALLVVQIRLRPERHRDRGGLLHAPPCRLHTDRLLEQIADAYLRQHSERRITEIPKQLVPDRVANRGRDLGTNAAGAERRCNRLDTLGHPPVRLAEHYTCIGVLQFDHARRDHSTRCIDNAADGAFRPDLTPQYVARIDARQASALQRTWQRMKIPPGDAVHHEGHRRIGTQ